MALAQGAIKFIQEMVPGNVEQQMRKQEASWKRGENAVKSHTRAVNRGGDSMAKFLGIGAGFAGVNQLVNRGIGLLQQYQEQLSKLADKSNETARGLADFVMLQPPGQAGRRHVAETLFRGARMGLTPEQVGAIAQPIQSIIDLNGQPGLQAAEQAEFVGRTQAAFGLSTIGVGADDAKEIISLGKTRGLVPGRAANLTIAAADTSRFGPKEFATAAPSLMDYSRLEEGLAAVSALSKEFPATDLKQYTKSLGRVLKASADDSEFSKKFGLAGLTESDKVVALAAYAMRNGDQSLSPTERVNQLSRTFASEGLEERSAQALGAAVRQYQTFESVQRMLPGTGSGLLGDKIAALVADPAQAQELRNKITTSLTAAAAAYGPEAETARQFQMQQQARGMGLIAREGGAQFVDTETGRPSNWVRAFDLFIEALGAGGSTTGAGGRYRQYQREQERETGAEVWAQKADEVVESMREVATAIQNQSGGKGKAPAPLLGEL